MTKYAITVFKGNTFVKMQSNGHEREDVVESRSTFLKRIIALGFLNENNVPSLYFLASLQPYL